LRVAALYDVHGNLPALETVLAEVPDDAEIVVGGDVAAGPFPHETLERLRGLGPRVRWVRGNADRELTPGEEGHAPPGVLEWVRSRLSAEEIEFLWALSTTVRLDGVLYCHATPRDDTPIFTEITPEGRVAPHFADVDADLVVCGHTHMQFDREIAGIRVINAGSVGMAYEDEPGAYWALLGPDVEFRRTAYQPDYGDWPGEWPSGTRAEATEVFEKQAI
jgi:putative phosphoesterase